MCVAKLSLFDGHNRGDNWGVQQISGGWRLVIDRADHWPCPPLSCSCILWLIIVPGPTGLLLVVASKFWQKLLLLEHGRRFLSMSSIFDALGAVVAACQNILEMVVSVCDCKRLLNYCCVSIINLKQSVLWEKVREIVGSSYQKWRRHLEKEKRMPQGDDSTYVLPSRQQRDQSVKLIYAVRW